MSEYLEDFQRTLLRTTHTYDFFVDWQKVESRAKANIVEYSLLNSLTLVNTYTERRDLLRKLLIEHPRIMTVLPILLAVRDADIEIADLTEQIIYRRFDFTFRKLNDEQLDEMLLFCEKTGIIELFGKIKDVYSYVLGVETGLDSNARKNRSGEVFKNLIDHLLGVVERDLLKSGFEVSHQGEVRLVELGITQTEKKQVDFLILKAGKPIVACEANVYNTQGSKPTEILRSYSHLQSLLRQRGMFHCYR